MCTIVKHGRLFPMNSQYESQNRKNYGCGNQNEDHHHHNASHHSSTHSSRDSHVNWGRGGEESEGSEGERERERGGEGRGVREGGRVWLDQVHSAHRDQLLGTWTALVRGTGTKGGRFSTLWSDGRLKLELTGACEARSIRAGN